MHGDSGAKWNPGGSHCLQAAYFKDDEIRRGGGTGVSRQELEALMDRWMTDPEFREAFGRDPEAAVRDSGLTLDAEEIATLRALDDDSPDEELQPRIIRS